MSPSCPRTCAKEITQQEPDYAKEHSLDGDEALETGMAEQSEAFKEAGGEVYS